MKEKNPAGANGRGTIIGQGDYTFHRIAAQADHFDYEAELALVGCILLDAGQTIKTVVEVIGNGDAIADPDLQIVYAEALAEHRDHRPVDMITMSHRLAGRDSPACRSWEELMIRATETVPTLARATGYARIVRDNHLRRQAVAVGLSLIEQLRDRTTDSAGIITEHVEELRAILGAGVPQSAECADRARRHSELHELRRAVERLTEELANRTTVNDPKGMMPTGPSGNWRARRV